MAVDLENFAYSFAHGTIKLADQQFTAIENITFSQDIDRAAVFGTSRKPLRRSAGQLQIGTGEVTFSDLDEGLEFYKTLGEDPSRASFAVDVTFENEEGAVRSYEIKGCVLSGISGDFATGGEALQQAFPFEFMDIKVDGVSFAK